MPKTANVAAILKKIDAEIALLTQARSILAEEPTPKRRGRPAGTVAKKHVLSPEARKKIADAQKKRWAKARKG